MTTGDVAVVERAWALSETAVTGIDHAADLCKDGKIDQAAVLVADVIEAFAGIQRAAAMIAVRDREPLEAAERAVQASFRRCLEAYEAKDAVQMDDVVTIALGPSFRAWRDVLRQAFGPYLQPVEVRR